MPSETTPPETNDESRIVLERDLYLNLLRLGKQTRIHDFLTRALEQVVELTGAERGYIEIASENSRGDHQRWFASHACEEVDLETIRKRVSRGVVAEAMSSGETVLSQSALLDERFSARESVRSQGLEAVLCAPIGVDPPLGVIYLDGQRGSKTFDASDKAIVELFSEHLAPLAERALLREMRVDDTSLPEDVVRLVGPSGFAGRSRVFVDMLRTAATVAPLSVHVLLTGESGTGKTQLARIIHNASPRHAEPFVELNCAALPETLLESELFGAAAGAHSAALRAAEGKIDAAGRGTLFLDEVGELGPSAQGKLLQFLQSKQYYPLGSTAARRSEARIIAATNADLRRAVQEKRFREDLLWRLEVLPLRLPSLSERRDDIDELADLFCNVIPVRHGLAPLPLSPAARAALRVAEWPGNVRQLEHSLEAALIRASSQRASSIGVAHVFPEQTAATEPESQTFQIATRDFQESLLRRTLETSDWNVSECARRLDLARSYVYSLIQAFGIARVQP
jgi:Nif-specific regulatory protein